MSFLVSPGVKVREIDLTTIVPEVSTTEGAIAGVFRWGPVDQRVLVDSEVSLVQQFAKPTNFNAETWFTAASFLGYGNRLYVSRAANTAGASPAVAAIVEAGNNIVKLAVGNTSVLHNGFLVLWAHEDAISTSARVQHVINSTAFSVQSNAYVYQTSVVSTLSSISTTAGNNTVTYSGNSDVLLDGMYITSAGNQALLGLKITSANSSAFEVETPPLITTTVSATASQAYEVQLISNTVFSAVAVANSELVTSLEYSTVKNKTDFTSKYGTFDRDVKFIARYPGEIGNSLRISMCANATGYESVLDFTSNTYSVEDSNPNPCVTQFTMDVNSNTSSFYIASSDIQEAYDHAVVLGSQIQVTDNLEVGNTLLGTQLMKITYIAPTQNNGTSPLTTNMTMDAYSNVAFISSTVGLEPGMMITAGNTAINHAIIHEVVNATALILSQQSSVDLTSSSTTFTPTSQITVEFEDPFKLAERYVYNSTNTAISTMTRYWEFVGFVDAAPGQSDYVINFGNSAINSDEMHIIVVDDGGKFTGVPGTILEAYRGVSRATDAKTIDGGANFWKDVINDQSQYIYAVNDISGAHSDPAENLGDSTLDVLTYTLSLGKDGQDEASIPLGILSSAYDLYKSKEDVDISLVLQGRARSFQLANYLIDNICEPRMDCVAFISPQHADVVNNPNNEADAIVSFRNNIRSSSYGVMDSGYKYMYDRYNDIYRWIPLNGDTAGLCVRTDETNDPWWSPAGFNRGQIKNIVKLAFNPRQAARDTLYKSGINPVVSFPGQGTILYGDKTLLAKPSAFDRINVRRLFIVLEKAISKASQYTLFEFNDAFTRSQFKSLVVPYLRDVKGRRGIYDFLVVCDETNNTPEVIDRNEFVGDIYIKPARSINFIQLNFIAVRTGVSFSEVVGTY